MFSIVIFIAHIIIGAFIIRFHVNSYQLGYNPLVSKLNQLTNPMVLPFSKLFKHKRFEWAALCPPIIIAVLLAFLRYHSVYISLVIGTLLFFASVWSQIIFYAMLIVVIGSWLQTDPRQPVMQIALSCCEWLLRPLRQLIPSFGGLDISPVAAIFALQAADYGLQKLAFSLIGV